MTNRTVLLGLCWRHDAYKPTFKVNMAVKSVVFDIIEQINIRSIKGKALFLNEPKIALQSKISLSSVLKKFRVGIMTSRNNKKLRKPNVLPLT